MTAVPRISGLSVATDATAFSFLPPAPARGRWPISFSAIENLVVSIDVAAVVLTGLMIDLIGPARGSVSGLGETVGLAILASALLVLTLKMRGLYKPTELLALRNQTWALAGAWVWALGVLLVAFGALGAGRAMGSTIALLLVCGFATLVGLRAAAARLLRKGLSGRKFAGRNVALVTDQTSFPGDGAASTLALLGFEVTAIFVLPPPGADHGFRKHLAARLIDHARSSGIQEIAIQTEPNRWSELRPLVSDLRVLPFPITFVPIGASAEIFRRPTRDVGAAICFELQRGPLSFSERVAKRTLDVVGASFALLVLSPLLAAVAIAIKLDSPGPVLFRQQRCGFNGRPFAIRKFRTMSVLEDGLKIVQAQEFDRRITRVGRWLRRTSIDELPQLIDVLEGTMSLVGPRPHALAHDTEFDRTVRKYAFRRRVKPGLTGWAQIHGCRGATPSTESIERRVEYDLRYIDDWSLRLELAILLQTPIELLRGRNAF